MTDSKDDAQPPAEPAATPSPQTPPPNPPPSEPPPKFDVTLRTSVDKPVDTGTLINKIFP